MIPLGNVLVIDDEKSSYEMYRDVLTREGYQVEWAPDAESAREKLQGAIWDVVVLDQRLSGAAGGDSGIDLLTEIVPTGAKVIVATAYADDAMIERAFRDGAYDYLEKLPTLPTLLRIKVRNALETVRERRLSTLGVDEREREMRSLLGLLRTEPDRNRKGRLIEELMVLLFKSIPGFTYVETRRKGRDEEIDLFIRNESTDPFWNRERSQYILVECKNWSKPVGPTELIAFRDKLDNRRGRCRLGLLVAVGGFTEGFHSRDATFRKDDALVVPLGPSDLEELVTSQDRSEVLKGLYDRSAISGNGH